MPELQIDVSVANRFISSLSKSLQALCHGCMDFDSGIEIVGYINVNIDCGSKVDYVLNEKVLKSTTNSMTFVSNSFLARKEHPKQTRDGACSPIAELYQQQSAMSSIQSRARGYMHSRNTIPSHSYIHHSSQKRSWPGMERDSRMTQKKARDGGHSFIEPGSTALHEHSPIPQHTHPNPLSSSFSQNPADKNFKWPQTSFQGSDTKTDSHNEVNIKTELPESENIKDTDPSEQDQIQTDQDANENTDKVAGVANIKCDPDASTTNANDESVTDEATNVNNEFKDSFLQPSDLDKNDDISEHTNTKCDNENAGGSSLQQPDVSVDEMPQENVTAGSENPVEYDETGEEGAYPHSVYSDAGEGSSDAGQFEVIEIEDEDEDVQAMFGEPHSNDPGSQHKKYHNSYKIAGASSMQIPTARPPPSSFGSYAGLQNQQPTFLKPLQLPHCTQCPEIFSDEESLKCHVLQYHFEVHPFSCSQCGKRYQTHTGLQHHVQSHKGKTFMCPVCDTKFTQKFTIKRHLRTVHNSGQCVTCQSVFKIGKDFDFHVVNCQAKT